MWIKEFVVSANSTNIPNLWIDTIVASSTLLILFS